MASLRMIALVAAMASLPSHPQMPGQAAGLVPSDDEEEALDLEPEHYKTKFEWLDKYGHPVTIVQLIGEARRQALACGADPAHVGGLQKMAPRLHKAPL